MMKNSHDKLKYENACHFATTNTLNRKQIFLDETCCKILWDEIFFYATLYQVDVYGFVIMPDHLHLLFWPRGKKTASEFMRGIKSMAAKKILSHSDYGWGPQTPQQPRILWQSTYFDYITTSKNTIQQKLEYIKQNPVEAKIVNQSEEYKWIYTNPNLYNLLWVGSPDPTKSNPDII